MSARRETALGSGARRRHTGGVRAISPTRASDDERERAVATLREHYADGRLPTDELEHRTHAAYTATDREELAVLFADLPPRTRRGWSPDAIRMRVRRAHRMLLGGHLATYLSVNGFLTAIWLLTGGGFYWPALYLVPSTALLTWHWMATRPLARVLSRPTAYLPGATILARVFWVSRRRRG
jgi:hypothetical protein